MILKRNLKLNEVAEIYSRSSQGGQAGSEPARGAAGSYLMFLGDGGHLRWGTFAIGDLCDGGPEPYNPGSTNKYTKFGQFSGNSLKLLPPDVTDAPNSIPGVCLSVRPSLRWNFTLNTTL